MNVSTYDIPGLEIKNKSFQCPVSYEDSSFGFISIFAREVSLKKNAGRRLPYMVYLQGGPGFGAPLPTNLGGFLGEVIKEYTVLLLDQRGTGQSTPITHQSLAKFESVEEASEYVSHFRADNIIRDCEYIRRSLIANDKWTIIGQSFGGFCCTTYLSMAPESLKEVYITAGLPPTEQYVDDVYRATYKRALKENEHYYNYFPQDRELVKRIVKVLETQNVRLPNGDRLSVRMFQTLGAMFGGSGGFERLHFILQQAFLPGLAEDELSYMFLTEVQNMNPFITNPIYALLHEAIYAETYATNWSAHRVRDEFKEFECSSESETVYFTGEMVYPWFFEEMSLLKPYKELANRLAEKSDWGALYDREQLQKTDVPTAAVIYYSDMFVEMKFSEELAELIQGIKLWVTNEYKHNGLGVDGAKIYKRLQALNRGEIQSFT